MQANVRGRDIGSFVTEAHRERGEAPAGVWLEWGGQLENLVAAKAGTNSRSIRNRAAVVFAVARLAGLGIHALGSCP